jgi:hypothetical protein
MSDNWGGDFIPGGRINLVEALSVAQHMPVEALEEALRRPQSVADPVLHALGRAASGEELSPRERNLAFWGMHVLASARDTSLFGPLLALLRRPGEAALELLGEVLETTLPKVIASTFDGEADALEAAIADRDADEVLRWSLFAAYSFLVFDGRIARERAHAFLVRFDDERLARAGSAAWAGWEEAIALLGFRDLAPRRAAAVADARLLTEDDAEDGFAAMLELAGSEPADPTRFDTHGLGYLDDPIGELDEALASDGEDEAPEPVQNPLRDVGRNDPCPCGSGKKFKKCCLAA